MSLGDKQDIRIKRKPEFNVSSESQAVPKIWTIGLYGF